MVAFKNTLHSQNDNLFLKVTRFFFKEERNRGEVILGLTFEKYSPTNHPFIQKIENLSFFFQNFDVNYFCYIDYTIKVFYD